MQRDIAVPKFARESDDTVLPDGKVRAFERIYFAGKAVKPRANRDTVADHRIEHCGVDLTPIPRSLVRVPQGPDATKTAMPTGPAIAPPKTH